MPARRWAAVVLAAGRGPNDPMAKAYGVRHKCTILIAGRPMLARVVDALRSSGLFSQVLVSVENSEVIDQALGQDAGHVAFTPSTKSAPLSALAAIRAAGHYPVLITTGDHPLLTAQMIAVTCAQAETLAADITVGLATAETILAAYPDTRRTFFKLEKDRVSGCNLFTVHSEAGLKLLETWSALEKNRKKPWKLVFAFGMTPLFLFATRRLTLARALEIVSRRLGIIVRANLLPFAEAAIDVDKPADKDLVERIFAAREPANPSSSPAR